MSRPATKATNATDQDPKTERLRTLLTDATYLPRPWVAGMIVVAIVSSIDVNLESDGGHWHVSVSAITLVAVALIWLPTALRLMSLTGGSVKAGGVEASASGILQSESFISDLANLRSSTEKVAQDRPDVKSSVEAIEAKVDDIATRYLPAEETLSPDVLDRLAREYHTIRKDMERGNARTIAMNKIVNEVRVRAAASPASADRSVTARLRSNNDGDRIVGLALAQASPRADNIDDLLRIFSGASSAFEQYHSLLALDAVGPILGSEQRARAVAVLEREKTDPREVGLMRDPYIPSWIDRVIKSLTDRAVG